MKTTNQPTIEHGRTKKIMERKESHVHLVTKCPLPLSIEESERWNFGRHNTEICKYDDIMTSINTVTIMIIVAFVIPTTLPLGTNG